MALRGQSGVAETGTTTISTITNVYAGTNGIQQGDLIILATVFDTGGSEGTITDPVGFTLGANLSPPIFDINVDSGGYYTHIVAKIAQAGDVGFPTFTTTLSAPAYLAQNIIVLSGRRSTLPAALSNQITSPQEILGVSPVTYTANGLNAVKGDDVIAIFGLGFPYGKNTETISASIPGYSNILGTFGPNNYSVGMVTAFNIGIASSGPTGSPTPTFSVSGSAINIDVVGIILSVQSATSGMPVALMSA